MAFRIRVRVRVRVGRGNRVRRCAGPAGLLAVVALGVPVAAVPGPAAASEPCRTGTAGEELPDGAGPHPLIDQLGLRQAWDLSTGAGVTVAVIDSGVDARHPGLADAVARGSEFTTSVTDERGYHHGRPAWQRDCQGHGTAVAGLIAARHTEGERIAGIAPGATVYPVRLAGTGGVGGTSDHMLAAAVDDDAVAAGARIINLSLANAADRKPVREAIARAVGQGVLVVAAAGNEGNANVSTGRMYPAAYDGVLAVGAVDAEGRPLDSSNAGPWVDIAGIGTPMTVLAPGGSGYRQAEGGTSLAAAQVSGAAALVLSRFPGLTARQVAGRLTGSASLLGGGVNDRTGAGLVDPFGALTHLGGAPGTDPVPGRLTVQPLPPQQPLLSATAAGALAVSGVLMLGVLLVLLAAPAVRRAARRGWRPGTAPVPSDPPGPPPGGAAPHPAAARLAWLDGTPPTTGNRRP
ncbi:S8 family serine peptidase [Streptomyces aidingensis]|uniref:Type VII secretion-associated serine protease mycosin n=1 Tax=Streptomyces aidingensis TaxID=910347 RepID=A0A1I1PUU2_9ACTN|nr:S8 family serine peptidase [Streptomyces aidingensis]SFD09660.1 type VII secretion-associated serine protease mycosin [Streptomyces aidingensis]